MYRSHAGDGPNRPFTPARLTLARKRRGLNKTELAAAAGVTQKSISEFEAERMIPSMETVERLARALKFPVEFFGRPEPELPDQLAVSFRALASLTAAQRDAAIGAGAIAFEVSRWIEERFTIPAADIPDLRELSPENAAATVREQWGLGVQPIRSMVHLLELHGVRVFSLTEQCRELDAFAVWHGSRPFCFLNTMKSVEHGRFDAAHELGHLVLHKHGPPQGREAEQQANDFASAFLMPSSTILANVQRGASLARLVAVKRLWGVSVAAVAYRAHKIGVLTEWHYRHLCIEIGRRHYRTNEPSPLMRREASQVLDKVFAKLREEGTSKANVARELCIGVHDLEAIVFGLVAFTGGRNGSSGKPSAGLRLVP